MKIAIIHNDASSVRQLMRTARQYGYEVVGIKDDLSALQSAHAVIWMGDKSTITPRSTKQLTAAMQTAGLKRLMVALGKGDSQDSTTLKHSLSATTLDWTITHSSAATLLSQLTSAASLRTVIS